MVVLGDSLVAGYGLPPGQAYPERLATKLGDLGYKLEIINAGVSGDTSSGGLARLDWSLGNDTDLILIELGANDALRGIPAEKTRENLDEMIKRLKARSIPVLLVGMLAPPNMGETYGEAFNSIYPDLAAKHETGFYPFFLDGVAAEQALNQDDGIHPNIDGISVILDRSLPTVERFLKSNCP